MGIDLELVRKILLEVNEPTGNPIFTDEELSRHGSTVGIKYSKWLYKAGLVDATYAIDEDGKLVYILGDLTWAGHMYLDKVQNPCVWLAIQRYITDKGLDVTFELVRDFSLYWLVK